ncbi:MAG: DUF2804 domain-containing protein [Candidatus Lokiarchaeota archaeon]
MFKIGTQNEITEKTKLFTEEGELKQRGWARKPILIYNKEDIGVGWHRIKEWDHYSIIGRNYGFQITIADIGYLGQMSVSLLDFTKFEDLTEETYKLFTKGKLNLPRSSLMESEINFPTDKFDAKIITRKGEREIELDYPEFKNIGLKAHLTLEDNPNMDNTVVVTGYKNDPHKFYYNHKINYMPADGTVQLGENEYHFSRENTFGLLDWGRGVWPYKTHWLWGSAAGKVNETPFAFNIGYGFGDLSTHTENIVFYNGKAHKLDKVMFHHKNRNPNKTWKFTSNDGRFNMILEPMLPRKSYLNVGIIKLDSVVLHGKYSGYIILDNGEKITIDNIMGHAEDIYWRW